VRQGAKRRVNYRVMYGEMRAKEQWGSKYNATTIKMSKFMRVVRESR